MKISRFSVFSAAVPLLALAFMLIFASSGSVRAETPKSYQVRWVAAHNPTNQPILKLTQEAADNMARRSGGRLKVSIVAHDNNTKNRHGSAIYDVFSGEAEVAQVEAGALRRFSQKMDVLNMPFLLKTHDRVRHVISGSIADKLKLAVEEGSGNKLKILAFTYSGGFRVMYGKKAISSIKDLEGAKTTISGPKPIVDFYNSFGAKFISKDSFTRAQSIDLHREGKIDFEDSELNRLFVLVHDYPEHLKSIKYVSETNHMFYLTTILANKAFSESLPKDLREIFESEVAKLAEAERAFSIKQAKESQDYLIKNGVKWVKMNPADAALFEKRGREFWKQYEGTLGSLIKEIEALPGGPVLPKQKASGEKPRKLVKGE
ncbi:MAG: TRAP transporter substrate-binding protein DctP [Bdellovibrionales bacterium]|jgi:TRAP-type C4-dicarboxylate transport system substrate-binding protein|nr:TRAP transporter substrate-binding protein DctP [Bdellovibrionales bacterium]